MRKRYRITIVTGQTSLAVKSSRVIDTLETFTGLPVYHLHHHEHSTYTACLKYLKYSMITTTHIKVAITSTIYESGKCVPRVFVLALISYARSRRKHYSALVNYELVA